MPKLSKSEPVIELAPRDYSYVAGFLSYLVPGLGQIYQGRVGKGFLFFVCLYGMFFFGMYLGSWSNVYLLDETQLPPIVVVNKHELPGVVAALGHRPQFAGQFWIGIAAWPAIWQYCAMPVPAEEKSFFWHNFQRQPYENRTAHEHVPKEKERQTAPASWKGKTLNELQSSSDKIWDLAWVYTVIAGVLNILVIYDAFAGPAYSVVQEPRRARVEDNES